MNDAMGEGVAGLRKANLSLAEDGTPQDILALSSIVDDTAEAAKIDLVFVIDTSGSMDDEWLVLPGIIRDLIETLTRVGIDLHTKVYSLQVVRAGIPGVEALTQGIFKGNIVATSMECWGPGTAWVAAYYPWRPGAYRIIIPISDEDCYQGVGQDANDLASIAEATELCRANNVEAYPFYGFSDTGQSVKDEMQTLAQGTGGEMFFFQDANQVVNYLLRVLSQKKVHYYLEYETKNISRDGTLRTVAIEASYRQAVGSGQGRYRAPQDSFGDLVITRFEADPVSAEDEVCMLRALVGNAGGVRVENAEVAFFLGDPRAGGILLEAKVLPALEPNATITLAVPWRSRAGEHRFYLVLDRRNEITETNEENNEAYVDLSVPGPGKPDLLVLGSEISFTQENPSCGQRIGIVARIRNIGLPSGPAEVGFYLGDPAGGGVLLGSSTIPHLDYLGCHEVECFWTAGVTPGEYAVWVLVDPLDAIEEEDEGNNKAFRSLTVNRRGVVGRIETDKAIYQSMEDALLTVAILNHEVGTWSGAARVVIKDGAGKVLADVAHFQLALDGGGEWRQSFIWNTGHAAPGGYLACLELYENEDLFAEYPAEFAIAPNRAADGRLATDKLVYAPMEKAAITVDLWNTGINTHLRDLILEVTVKDSFGGEVWTDRAAVAYLPVGEGQAQVFYWPIGRSKSGEYTVAASLRAADGAVLWSATRTVTVVEAALLAGTLTVNPRQTQAGREVEFAYTVTNIGNKRLAPLPLQIMLVHPETKEIGLVIACELAMEPGETHAEATNRTVDLPDARYMAVMQAIVDGASLPLSSTGLLVDSTPPVTTADLSDLRLIKDGVFYGVIGSTLTLAAVDNLSGVAETLYDLGPGQVRYEGPIVFTAEGVYEIGFRSVDRLGNAEDWQSMRIVIDQTPPVVRILAPAEGEEVPPDLDAVIEAFDNLGLQLAELYVDGEKCAEFTDSPAKIALYLPPGPHTLRARALDVAGYETWTPPVGIQVVIPDTIPPVTTAVLFGERMYCGAYKPEVTVILTALDNEGGSGVAGIYYSLDGGAEELYSGPFAVGTEGRHILSYYAVDHAGNREEKKTLEFRIVKPWTAPYGLLCRSLKTKGRAEIQSAFVNGPVDLGGRVHLGYLGTTERCIRKTRGVEIERLETKKPPLPLPVPDWAALRAATRRRMETKISGYMNLSDVHFAKGLYLSGKVRITGLLVVEGDLTIAGHL
ncbi:MAG: hypothetical protein K6U03_06120, partial [Firmicutes bacterium]|nr:hypothetical protein [Bacillota bacterium]